MAADTREKVPILLLKTRSTPTDTYEEYFRASNYDPVFVPVLEHRSRQDALDKVRRAITGRGFLRNPGQTGCAEYGAIIFTSQRAVEAFAQVIKEIREEGVHRLDEVLPAEIPLYAVGPATARALRAIGLKCPVLGEESGTGEVLSAFMLEHYNNVYKEQEKPPLMFLVGDKRRDIIPKTLQNPDLPDDKRCKLEELVIYETGEMLSFKSEFSTVWKRNSGETNRRQWVVVFSPTGCKAMLESLGLLDEQTGKVSAEAARAHNIYVATIGPTTRDYLIDQFAFVPDVCADAPSEEGVARGIEAFDRSAGR
jgi:uroporphyrinogen-III synthase